MLDDPLDSTFENIISLITTANFSSFSSAPNSNHSSQPGHNLFDFCISKGDNCVRLSLYGDALNYYTQAIAINSNNSLPWHGIGLAEFFLNHFDRSVAAFDQAIELDPDNSENWFNRGITLVKLLKFDDSLFNFDRAIELDPNNPTFWINRSLVLNQLKRCDESIDSIDRYFALRENISPADSSAFPFE